MGVKDLRPRGLQRRAARDAVRAPLLLLLARLDGQHLRRTPTDLAAVCESVAARYATARVPVRAETAGPCVVEGDADALAPRELLAACA